jgi:hypothetical protein
MYAQVRERSTIQIRYFENGGGGGSGGGSSGRENLVGVLLNWRHTHTHPHMLAYTREEAVWDNETLNIQPTQLLSVIV